MKKLIAWLNADNIPGDMGANLLISFLRYTGSIGGILVIIVIILKAIL